MYPEQIQSGNMLRFCASDFQWNAVLCGGACGRCAARLFDRMLVGPRSEIFQILASKSGGHCYAYRRFLPKRYPLDAPQNPDACFYGRRRYFCFLPVPFICCVQLRYPEGLGIYKCFDIRRQGIGTISFRSLWKDGLHFLYRSCSLRMVSADPTGLSHRRLETPLAYVRALHRMIKDSFSAAVFS